MHFVLEAIFVGIYTVAIYRIIKPYIKNNNALFFATGFLKHLFGWFLGLHSLYCQIGEACSKYVNGIDTKRIFYYNIQPFIESIMEGIIFLGLGILIIRIAKQSKYIIVFFIGFILHILFEIFGFHNKFCLECCKR
jgi:hypothetical protein